MSDNTMSNVQIVSNIDTTLDDASVSGKGQFVVHFRIQQRGGRKSITTISGLPDKYDFDLILKYFKKTFNCNGSLEKNKEGGLDFKLSGDQRKAASDFFLKEGILTKENIKIHGF